MQIKGKYSWLKHIDFMIVDLIALFLSFWFSFYFKFKDANPFKYADWNLYLVIIILLDIIITLFSYPYSGILRRPYYLEIFKSLSMAISILITSGLVFYILKKGASFSREVTIVMTFSYFILSTFLKFIWRKILISGVLVIKTTTRMPLFIIGKKESIEKNIINVTACDFQIYDIVAVHLIDDNSKEICVNNKSIKAINNDYVKFILENDISEVLVAINPFEVEKGVLEKLNSNGIGINIIVEETLGFLPEDQFIQNIGVYKSLSIGAFTFTPVQLLYLTIKKIIDFFAGLIGLVVLIPVTIFVKIATLISGDTSRIFYKQKRVGQYGKDIYIWKFRSMVSNADEVLKELLKDEKYKKEWDINQKFENDPRITKVGKFLRKTSIDEMPQLVNVLLGQMSLVGPRPLVPGELEQHDGLKLYQKVKPGITGWWACNGRSNIEYRERLELEYYYVKNCSLYLDALCIFRTIFAVLKKEGAK